MELSQIVRNKLATAIEFLESGIAYGNVKFIRDAKTLLENVYPLLPDRYVVDEERGFDKNELMIRALSSLCVYDGANGLSYMNEAQKYDARHPVVLNNLGFIYHKRFADFDKSVQWYQECLGADPTFVQAYLGIIDVYRSLRLCKSELEYSRLGIEKCPDSPELWNSYGLALLHGCKHSNVAEIFDAFELGLQKNPDAVTKSKLLLNLGHLHGVLGDFDLSVDYYLRAIDVDPKHHFAYQNILLNLHFYSDRDVNGSTFRKLLDRFNVPYSKRLGVSTYIDRLHGQICKTVYGEKVPDGPPKSQNMERKLNVGYVSADLIGHAVANFARALFVHANRSAFDVYVYSNTIYDAGGVSQIPCTAYRCIDGVSATDVAAQIKQDGIDILIDLSGFTSGNRLDVFALRPAPVLLTYLGYPDTVGLPYVQRISDKYTECMSPRNESVLKLDRLFLCYTPTAPFAEHVKSYEKFKPKTSTVTFGCFCKLQKINDHVVRVWKLILNRVPRSRLLMKSRYFEDPKVAEKWKDKFGEDRDRVVLLKGAPTPEEHMQMYKLLDVHLDTWPYSGTTITTESLYMNVPVITLSPRARGSFAVGHVQRVSGSILTSMGLENDCVAVDEEDYVRKAQDIVKKLNGMSVRKRFLHGEIADGKGFMNAFEELLLQKWTE